MANAHQIPAKLQALVTLFDQVGNQLLQEDSEPSSVMADDAWTCSDGALFAAFLCDILGLQHRLSVGLYYHQGPEFLAELRGEDVEDVVEPYDEHHHWVVINEGNGVVGKWLLDPNGEARGEPRLQQLHGNSYWLVPESLREWWASGRPNWIPDGAKYVADDQLAVVYSSSDNPTDLIMESLDVWQPALKCLCVTIQGQYQDLIDDKAIHDLEAMIHDAPTQKPNDMTSFDLGV
jgi:hypothetical protein